MRAADVDDVLTTQARLAIMATLAAGRGWSFTELRDETGLADGNLHVQTGRLVKAGYVTKSKTTDGGRTLTLFEVTPSGREAFCELVRRLRNVKVSDPPVRRSTTTRRRGESETDDSRVW